jgi:hypothetical protein
MYGADDLDVVLRDTMRPNTPPGIGPVARYNALLKMELNR